MPFSSISSIQLFHQYVNRDPQGIPPTDVGLISSAVSFLSCQSSLVVVVLVVLILAIVLIVLVLVVLLVVLILTILVVLRIVGIVVVIVVHLFLFSAAVRQPFLSGKTSCWLSVTGVVCQNRTKTML